MWFTRVLAATFIFFKMTKGLLMKFTIFLPVLSILSILSFNTHSEDLTKRSDIELGVKNLMCLQDSGFYSLGVTSKECSTMTDEIVNKCVSKLPEKFPDSMIESSNSPFVKCSCKVYENYVSDIKKIPGCS
jgi:hypothetical protein